MRGSAAASEIRVYIQDDNHDKENVEDQDNIEKILEEELEETPQKRSVSVNFHRVRWTMRRDEVMILRLIDEYEARPCLWDFAHATAGELSSNIMNFFGHLTM